MQMPRSRDFDVAQNNWMKNYGKWQNFRLGIDEVRLRLVTEAEIWPKSKFAVFLQAESKSGNALTLSWQLTIAQDGATISKQRYRTKTFDRQNPTLGQWLQRSNSSKMINPNLPLQISLLIQ